MIGAREAIGAIDLPLEIGRALWDGTVLNVGGDDWSLTTMSPWRLTRHGALVTSYENEDGDHPALAALVGRRVVECVAQSSLVPLDPAFVIDDGSVLEVFGTDTLEPWVLGTARRTVVADSQGPYEPVERAAEEPADSARNRTEDET